MSLNLLPGAVSEILATSAETQSITLADRYGLMAAILNDELAEEERCAVDRMIRALCRGRIQIVDELSLVM